MKLVSVPKLYSNYVWIFLAHLLMMCASTVWSVLITTFTKFHMTYPQSQFCWDICSLSLKELLDCGQSLWLVVLILTLHRISGNPVCVCNDFVKSCSWNLWQFIWNFRNHETLSHMICSTFWLSSLVIIEHYHPFTCSSCTYFVCTNLWQHYILKFLLLWEWRATVEMVWQCKFKVYSFVWKIFIVKLNS